MPWSTDGRNARADATTALITHVSLHSAEPDGSGDNELPGTGGYVRLAPSYGSAAAGVADLTATLEFSTVADQAIHSIGYWATSTFLGAFPRTSGDATANAAGEYNVTSAPITGVA